MHFWIDKRSQTCGFSGRHRVPASLSAAGCGQTQRRQRRRSRGKPMVTPVHRFQPIECVGGGIGGQHGTRRNLHHHQALQHHHHHRQIHNCLPSAYGYASFHYSDSFTSQTHLGHFYGTLYCIVLKGWSLLPNALQPFQDLLHSPEFLYY